MVHSEVDTKFNVEEAIMSEVERLVEEAIEKPENPESCFKGVPKTKLPQSTISLLRKTLLFSKIEKLLNANLRA